MARAQACRCRRQPGWSSECPGCAVEARFDGRGKPEPDDMQEWTGNCLGAESNGLSRGLVPGGGMQVGGAEKPVDPDDPWTDWYYNDQPGLFSKAALLKTVALPAEGWICPGLVADTRARHRVATQAHQVFVKTLRGCTVALHVEDGTLTGLKRLVSAREGIAPAEQRLTFAGRDLGDGTLLLSECGVPRSATLHLSLRLRGGLELGRALMCVQALQMVVPTVREWIRSCWNACAKPENQCPVRQP